MKKLAIFCALLIGVMDGAFAAAARNPRGSATTASGENQTTATRSTTARSATTTRSAAPTRNAAATTARAATTGRTTVSRTPAATTSTSASTVTRSAVAARAGITQKVINTGTSVAGANENVIVSEACRQKYYGCMDSFCMLDNDNGGRCICSDRNAELDDILAQIEELDQQSYQMATYGVERIEMGDAAEDAIANANAVAESILNAQEEDKGMELDLTSWLSPVDFTAEDVFADTGMMVSPIEGKEGDALYQASHQICVEQMPECSSELAMLQLMYAQQIRSDCSAYENSLKQQKNASAQKLYVAEQALRDAALEQYQNANKYDLGQCVVEFKNCMIDTGGCGEDFSGCASVAAFDSKNTRGRGGSASTYEIQGAVTSIEIQASTYDILVSKKPLCDTVTQQCRNVADQVWDTFLREVAPQVKSAELIAEDNARQNCIGNISSCFQQACRDTMDPNDPDGSYDMCLTRPETMLNLCQVPLNACGINTESAKDAQESDIWDFVVARLASMRVNSCATQVKQCLQSEDRCGPDYSQCIGLDVKAVSQMCPIEALTACQQVDSEGNKLVTSIEDIEDMIWGIYLSIDNALLDQCQKAVDDKMIEICGDVNDCSAFTDDNVMGTESLLSYTDSNGNYVIDGLVSFGNVEVLKSSVKSENYPGGEYTTYAIDINNYREHLDVNDPSAARVVSALESVANKIAQKIAILRQDPDIQMCVEGRNLYQVNRGANATARFPYLLDSSIMTIVSSGLDQARQNYNRKYDELVESALESQSDQIKSVLCASMASSGAPQCASYITVDGEAICETYEAPKLDAVFGNTDDSQNKIGVNGNDIYSTKYVIAGADISEWASAVQSGRSEYTQVDSMGNMLGKINMSSVYSAANDTCTITTTTTMCDTMEALVLSSTSTSCGSGGIQILGGSGCSGAGGGLISIGGGGKKTTTTQTYAGTQCTSFMDPVTTTNTIKM